MADVAMECGEEEEFHLSGMFEASNNDVKGMVTTGSNEIVIAGREEKIKFFAKRRGEYAMYKELPQGDGLVINSLAYYQEKNMWLIFAGRKNGSIVIYDNSFTEITVVTQHSSNVCCLHVDQANKKLLSGSWDNNVIVWPIEQISSERFQALLLTGHTMSVWGLETFNNRPDVYLSASADKTIKLWERDDCVRTYNGHTDVVRCLQTLSNDTFISAANDSTYRVWHIESTASLNVIQSRFDEFIFNIKLVDNTLISCGETGFVEIFKVDRTNAGHSLKTVQTLKTPATTNWVIATLSETEFAIGTNDGRIYLYSSDPEKKASPDIVNAVQEQMSEKTVSEMMRKEQQANEEIVIKVALDDGNPNLELRYQKGSDPALAAENFIRANNLPVSYLNEITDYIVANIPEAKQAQNRKYGKQQTQKLQIDGEMYDYAMDVTIGDKTLKMPFNVGEDPNTVAWRFCEKHSIPPKYAPQLAQLVKNDLQGISKNSNADFYDPFTGGGRYIPGQSANSSAVSEDPFTGTGRYVPNSTPTSFKSDGDPFTSGGRYIPGKTDTKLLPNASRPADKLRPKCDLVPLTEFYFFGVDGPANPKALAKLKETNEHQEGFKLNPEQIVSMENLFNAQPGTITVGNTEKSALELGLLWPFQDIGIIIDLLRCALLHEELNQYFCDEKKLGQSIRNRLFEILVSNPPSNVKVFICRAIANIFAHSEGREMMAGNDAHFIQLVSQVISCFMGDSSATGARQLQIAASSSLANWSFLLLQKSQEVAQLGPREDVLRALVSGLEAVDSFGDKDQVAMIRLLQTIVTLMWGDKQVIQTAKNRNIVSIVNKLKDAVTSEAGKNVARCIVEMTFNV